MTTQPARAYKFGSFVLIPGEGRLLEAGKPVPISPRASDLLVALVKHHGLASKKDLLQAVWPGLVVEENTLQAQVSALRKLLGAEAIHTVSGRGYRFAMDVEAVEVDVPLVALSDDLPRFTTSFVGRVREGAEIKRLLSRSRLVTIVGPDGWGKTRLAIEVTSDSRSTARPTCFVELATVTSGAQLAQRIASALGVGEQPGRLVLQGIVERLGLRPALVVLDNAEHLLTTCGELVDELLTRSANVSFLVTGREPLGVSGEAIFSLPRLPVPDQCNEVTPAMLADCESVNLFVERVRQLRQHFAVDSSNASLVATICRRLDGIPLAIELAAPRLRSMSLVEMNRSLEQRFSGSTNEPSGRIARQFTLHAMIDWSFELITPAEQAVLCRASVFSGGWDLGAAEALCAGGDVDAGDILDILVSLDDKNLLSTVERSGVIGYRMLETVRQYASERLRVPTGVISPDATRF
jgi:predicted ATPase/DNA-binding winged helix-turn-helix (wHTH) protein